MLGWRNKRDFREQAAEYATRQDFQRIFTEEIAGLHLLALLLTADEEKAEKCLVAGLEESVRDNAVFRQWARSWSKRAIIKNAIKAVSPVPMQPGIANQARSAPARAAVSSRNEDSKANVLIAAVTSLEPFTRFVLVMAVLEGYSVRECSILLGCPPREVAAAKSQALEQLGSLPVKQPASGNAKVSWASLVPPTQVA